MPDRKGTVSGFIVAGFGAGAAVFTGVATGWVNPDNASPNPATGFYSRVSIPQGDRPAEAGLRFCAKRPSSLFLR